MFSKIALCALVVALARTNSLAEVLSAEDIGIDIDMTGASRTWVFSATVGQDWSGFPITQHRNWITSGTNAYALNHTGDLWITGVTKSDGATQTWQEYPQPRRLTEEEWISENPVRLLQLQMSAGVGPNCCWYDPCPAITPSLPAQAASEVCDHFGCCPVIGGLQRCPARNLFESGDHPVDMTGAITLLDAHGGALSDTWVVLRLLTYYQGPGDDFAQSTLFVIIFATHRAGTFQVGGDRAPGAVLRRRYFLNEQGGIGGGSLQLPVFVDTIILHHTSADLPGASPGAVDAGDLSGIAAHLGSGTVYDFFFHQDACTEAVGGPWYADVNGSGCIDFTDIIWWVYENTWSPLCDLSKTDNSQETNEILSWFGIRRTGRVIVDRGVELPEVELADQANLERGIRNPYGYRDAPAASQSRAWSRVKSIYR